MSAPRHSIFISYRRVDSVYAVDQGSGGKLAELIAAERTLLVLDGLEPLQQPSGGYGGEFKDPATKALLRGLALNNPGLCILTSGHTNPKRQRGRVPR